MNESGRQVKGHLVSPAGWGSEPGRGCVVLAALRRCSPLTRRRWPSRSVGSPSAPLALCSTASLPPGSCDATGRAPPPAPSRSHKSNRQNHVQSVSNPPVVCFVLVQTDCCSGHFQTSDKYLNQQPVLCLWSFRKRKFTAAVTRGNPSEPWKYCPATLVTLPHNSDENHCELWKRL